MRHFSLLQPVQDILSNVQIELLSAHGQLCVSLEVSFERMGGVLGG